MLKIKEKRENCDEKLMRFSMVEVELYDLFTLMLTMFLLMDV